MKKLLCIIMFSLTVFVLAACGANEQKEETTAVSEPALDKETEAQITVAGSYDNFEALEAEFERFNKLYPNVQLSYVKPDDYNNTLDTVLEGNNAPDIFFSFAWMQGNEKYDQVFARMEDLSDPELGLDLDCIRPGLLSSDEEGHVLMVPVFSRSYGMLVNNDLFEKEGLNVPSTWSELKEVCEAFKSKGYTSPIMGYSNDSSGCMMNYISYPVFVSTLAEDSEALKLANDLDPEAGEYMRPALEILQELIEDGYIDIEKCNNEISDNYSEVILRFFEGDVPMMIATGDTVSGTKKRESQSEAYEKEPFTYTFAPVPVTEEGGYFIDSPSVEFSVNKNSENLDIVNEFMRFLITEEELNEMASIKRLLTPANDLSFDSVYAPFGNVNEDHIFSPEAMGITDPLSIQIRNASFLVGTGEMTIDEAVEQYGSFE